MALKCYRHSHNIVFCIIGSVTDKNGDVQYQLEGGWVEGLRAKPCEGLFNFTLGIYHISRKDKYMLKWTISPERQNSVAS